MMELEEKAKRCKEASYELSTLSLKQRNEILECMAIQIKEDVAYILNENKKDIACAIKNHKDASFIDRLTLDSDRLGTIVKGIYKVMALEDPIHHVMEQWTNNGLSFQKVSVAFGVIGIIYEARPNVSVDAACLCLKSGNACFLRGSKDTIYSNVALVASMKKGIRQAGFDADALALLEDTSRETSVKFMQLNQYLDLLIPRGSAALIQSAINHASVPIIETGTGNCHVYVDAQANIEKALAIILNSKCQRVSVCNACESILVHKDVLDTFMPRCIEMLKEHHVIIHGSEIIQRFDRSILLASESDYRKEYLAYELSIKEVSSLQEAISHINHYGTHHSDVIVSEDTSSVIRFQSEVDSAVVYHNVSSRFSDGECFGFGAEIGISTQKMHARGPMGIKALTTYKYLVDGTKTIRD